MSILNGVVAMDLDSPGYEGPSTPLKDPTSSPAVHIQWQNSQSACAAMEELRVASSVPRRPPKPLTFDFELPASAGPSSHASDPFSSSRARVRPTRLRTLERVQSHSQNDVFAIPTADTSKFLDMLGRASARVDENSRKRMKALGERARVPKRSLMKGKERMCATTARGTRSMDELGDHTNFIRDAPNETGLLFSSLPIVLQARSKDPLFQPGSTDDVHMHAEDHNIAPAPGNDGIKPPVSSHPQNGTQHLPLRAAALTTRISQKRIEPPSPTPVRPAPIPLRPVPAPAPAPAHNPKSIRASSECDPSKSTPGPLHPPAHLSSSSSTHTQSRHPHPIPAPTPLPPAADSTLSKEIVGSAVPMADSIPRHGASASTAAAAASLISALPPSSQTHGSRRALGMTRISVPLSSSKDTRHSAVIKKPFRPPLARPAMTPATVRQVVPPASATASSSSHQRRQQQQQRQKEDGSKKRGSGGDPDSSFDASFDFDPEALEAAMKKYD